MEILLRISARCLAAKADLDGETPRMVKTLIDMTLLDLGRLIAASIDPEEAMEAQGRVAEAGER